jgi:hypothetical protein
MITDPKNKSVRSTLDRTNLPDYWSGYFTYERVAPDLHLLTQTELTREVDKCKSQDRPFVDSQVIINQVFTRFGSNHTFHRQFSERFPELHREQILGMQLYTIMLRDEFTWIYMETQHQGHLFPHATYFIPEQ